jgi:hypothetical protein
VLLKGYVSPFLRLVRKTLVSEKVIMNEAVLILEVLETLVHLGFLKIRLKTWWKMMKLVGGGETTE